MNVPNALTVSRIGFAFVLMILISLEFPFAKTLAFALFVIAGITDYLDGYLARNVYGTSSFGKLMDPLADKIMVCACFVSFVAIQLDTQPGPLVPAFLVVLIISREFMVTGLRLVGANKGKVISAGRWGKHKTVWQIVVIIVILIGLSLRYDVLPLANLQPNQMESFEFGFKWLTLALMIGVSIITVASGVKYFTEHSDLISRNL